MGAEGRMEAPPVAAGPDAGPEAPAPLRAVERALGADPASFGFFQAVRLLERLRPGRARVGHFADPADELVRFSVHPSLAFPPGELHALRLPDEGPAAMSVNFMGLTGAQGVLPPHYTLLARERAKAGGEAAAFGAFLDLFHHRMLSLFYRAWEKNRVPLPAERGEDDPLRRHLLDVAGEGGAPDGAGDALGEALVHYAGLFAPLPRGAVALEQLLGDVFGVPAAVEQFVGGWYPLAAADQCRLGDDEEDGAGGGLGHGAVVGDQAWHPQSGIRIRLGPLGRGEYDRFLPTGPAYPLLRRLVRFYTHDQFECELQLVLARADVPPCVLGGPGEPQPLGWSTWARARALPRDADDTVLRL
jgi:type VI secretion system protein ImpH